MERHKAPFVGLIVLTLYISGCRHHEPAPYLTFYVPPTNTFQAPVENNAFADYLRASQAVDEAIGMDGTKLLRLTSFTPAQRLKLEKAASRGISLVTQAKRKHCEFPYVPTGPLTLPPGRTEWRLIARVLVWKIGDDVANGKYDEAIEKCALLTKFGFDVASGGPSDASLGWSIVNDAREALIPALPKLSAVQLRHLSQSIKSVFLARPPLERTINNAVLEMQLAIQTLQDHQRSGDLKPLEPLFGADAKDAIKTLTDLSENEKRRVAFFNGVGAELKRETDLLVKGPQMTAADRLAILKEKRRKPGAYRLYWRTFLTMGYSLMDLSNVTEARTQMLILDAEIRRTIKQSRMAPLNLDLFTSTLTRDPYSLRPFQYTPDGLGYRLYSVGDDGVDNGGTTDEAFLRPDVTLEK